MGSFSFSSGPDHDSVFIGTVKVHNDTVPVADIPNLNPIPDPILESAHMVLPKPDFILGN